MSFGIKKATAGAPVSGTAQRTVREGLNKTSRGPDRPGQTSKVTRGDTKGPGR